MLGVKVNTVLRALRTLPDDGLLEFRRGRGITVSEAAAARGAVVGKARELIGLGCQYGYGRAELTQIIEELA